MLEKEDSLSILAIQQIWRQYGKPNSWMPRSILKGNAALWHAYIRHPDPMSLHKLERNYLRVKLRGLSVTEYSSCAQAKIKQ